MLRRWHLESGDQGHAEWRKPESGGAGASSGLGQGCLLPLALGEKAQDLLSRDCLGEGQLF